MAFWGGNNLHALEKFFWKFTRYSQYLAKLWHPANSCGISKKKCDVLMPNLPMWTCPKPAGLQTSQAEPAFNVLLFQKNWPTYLLRYTTSIQRSQESMSRAVTVSHIIYDFCIDFGAAPRTRRPHLTAVRARATPARPPPGHRAVQHYWGSLHTPSSPGTWLYHNIY